MTTKTATLVKWKTGTYSDDIERVECTGETSETVLISGGRRRLKRGQFDQYHDTWEAAHAYLLFRAEQVLQEARLELLRAQDAIVALNGMRKPQEAP